MAKRAAKVKKAPAPRKRKARNPRAKTGMLTNFARMVATERDRLHKTLNDAVSRKSAIEREIAAIQHELGAVLSFFSTSKGKPAKMARTRSPRGQKRQQLLDLIRTVPEGLTRGEIIHKLNAVEKSAQQSISNALSALFKSKAVKRSGRRYFAA